MIRTRSISTIRTAITAAAVMLSIGTALVSPALASPIHQTIAQRTEFMKSTCTEGGGTSSTETTKGSVTNGHQVIKQTTTCSGGIWGGETCTFTKNNTTCAGMVRSPFDPIQQATGNTTVSGNQNGPTATSTATAPVIKHSHP